MDFQTYQQLPHPTIHHTQHKPELYDPALSTTSKAALQDWLKAPILEDMQQVPGIGKKNAETLFACGCTSTFQLLGLYLQCRVYGMSSVDHCNRFHEALRARGVHSHVNAIVQACAERCNVMFPGIYDGESQLVDFRLQTFDDILFSGAAYGNMEV